MLLSRKLGLDLLLRFDEFSTFFQIEFARGERASNRAYANVSTSLIVRGRLILLSQSGIQQRSFVLSPGIF